MKLIYVMYNRRTCVTGKALFDELTSRNIPNLTFRRCNVNPPRQRPDLVLRWGNSLHEVPEGTIELNTREALSNTTDKLKMLRLLEAAEGVRVPNFTTTDQRIEGQGNVYIRDANDHVRYASATTVKQTDKYVMQPIDKVREFRVHVFNGRTIGIYEKIPHDPTVKIYKNDTCDFRRIDQSSEDAMRGLNGMRPMAREAVNALGLLFGGVDVLLDRDGNFFITEVNSSPALNGPNLDRWADTIQDYVTHLITKGATNQETEQDRIAEQARLRALEDERNREAARREELERERLRVARMTARENLITRMRALAETEGFAITNLDLADTVVTQ